MLEPFGDGNGRIARALRTLLRASAQARGKRAVLEIVD